MSEYFSHGVKKHHQANQFLAMNQHSGLKKSSRLLSNKDESSPTPSDPLDPTKTKTTTTHTRTLSDPLTHTRTHSATLSSSTTHSATHVAETHSMSTHAAAEKHSGSPLRAKSPLQEEKVTATTRVNQAPVNRQNQSGNGLTVPDLKGQNMEESRTAMTRVNQAPDTMAHQSGNGLTVPDLKGHNQEESGTGRISSTGNGRSIRTKTSASGASGSKDRVQPEPLCGDGVRSASADSPSPTRVNSPASPRPNPPRMRAQDDLNQLASQRREEGNMNAASYRSATTSTSGTKDRVQEGQTGELRDRTVRPNMPASPMPSPSMSQEPQEGLFRRQSAEQLSLNRPRVQEEGSLIGLTKVARSTSLASLVGLQAEEESSRQEKQRMGSRNGMFTRPKMASKRQQRQERRHSRRDLALRTHERGPAHGECLRQPSNESTTRADPVVQTYAKGLLTYGELKNALKQLEARSHHDGRYGRLSPADGRDRGKPAKGQPRNGRGAYDGYQCF